MGRFKIDKISTNSFPNSLPIIMSGKLNCKIRLKKDRQKVDGTYSVHIQISLNRVVRKFPLAFSVLEKDFDLKNQKIKSSNKFYKDYNLYIEKKLADINTIEVNYRLSNKNITLDLLIQEMTNPTAKIDFIKFWTDEMINQKKVLKNGTYKQQLSSLKKVKNFRETLFFYEIDLKFFNELKNHCKVKLKNSDVTVSTLVKNFKKYLHIANEKGMQTPLKYYNIKNKTHKSNRTFLLPDEIKKLYDYWNSTYINDVYKNILSRFLFSCFTGLRFSDVERLTSENFANNSVVFTAEKTGKFQRIKLNDTALQMINDDFFIINSTNQHTNRELKDIAKSCGITKKVTYHVSRHTFATNFLLCGGRLENLQKILAHSKIEETMIYVHIVDQIKNDEIMNMDIILKNKNNSN
jgi:integrase/recombinase XerD